MQQQPLQITVLPAAVLIQSGRGRQRVNCDFWIQSQTAHTWTLDRIELKVLTHSGKLVLKRRLDGQAVNPSIELIAQRQVGPNGSLYIFNPFSSFDARLELQQLQYTFHFSTGADRATTSTVDVFPVPYHQQVELVLPLKGRMLVDDGNDDYAHHRRVALAHPLMQQMGLRTNDGRFAWDFVMVDEAGNDHHIDTRLNQHFYTFGAPVYAPGDGVVLAARTDVSDNQPYQATIDMDSFRRDSMVIFGNYVSIDHQTGEYSTIAHCQSGSIQVRVGDTVRRGDLVAQGGNSGWSYYPHVHYQLTNRGQGAMGEGLPAQFNQFDILMGNERITLKASYPETGEIVFQE